MAWKMRKDKAQTAPAEEGARFADTAVSEEVDTAISEESEAVSQESQESGFEEPAFQDFGNNPFVMASSEEEPLGPPVFDFTPADTESAFAEPAFAEPVFDEAAQRGPFAPLQPAAAEEATPLPEALDRDTIAPGLVHTASDMEVPRVAPFIVDLPPAADGVLAAAGTLSVRIGNFSALFQVTKDVTLIGRPDSVLQSYPDVEIELDDAVSRRHAELHRREGQYFLADLHSTNGTLLNGRALEPDREYPLSPGDRIHLGDRTEIVFE